MALHERPLPAFRPPKAETPADLAPVIAELRAALEKLPSLEGFDQRLARIEHALAAKPESDKNLVVRVVDRDPDGAISKLDIRRA